MSLTASEINSLKTKVKAEMNRRSGYGSLTSYGSSSYDFTTSPTSDAKILTEQGQKVRDLLLQIKDIPNTKLAKTTYLHQF